MQGVVAFVVGGASFPGEPALKAFNLFVKLDLGPEGPDGRGRSATLRGIVGCGFSLLPEVPHRPPCLPSACGERVRWLGGRFGKTMVVKVLASLYWPTASRALGQWDPKRVAGGDRGGLQDQV